MPEEVFRARGIIALTIVAPLGMILSIHYKMAIVGEIAVCQKKSARLRSSGRRARRCATRIEVLESILDDVEPGWRRRA